jgi:uncharacterized protein (DUF58 family)
VHRSPHSGFSVEFQEHREYTPGEDLRHLDWKVFGRTDKYYLKRFENETSLVCHLVVDVSESMVYRGPTADVSKLHYASCLAASLAWLMLQQRNGVSLTTIDAEVRSVIAPASGAPQLNRVLQTLEAAQPVAKTDLQRVLHETAGRLKQRGVVIVISDFFEDVDAVLSGLRSLVQRQHDVIALQVMDRAEISFPFQNPTRFHGLEQFPTEVVDPIALGRAYRATINKFLEQLRRRCADQQVEYGLCCTDEDPGTRLAQFLSERRT